MVSLVSSSAAAPGEGKLMAKRKERAAAEEEEIAAWDAVRAAEQAVREAQGSQSEASVSAAVAKARATRERARAISNRVDRMVRWDDLAKWVQLVEKMALEAQAMADAVQ